MATLDWTKSGRIDDFSFETLPNTVRDIKNAKATGKLENVVAFKLEESYSSSEKVTGTIEVRNQNPIRLNNNLVRIYYCPKLETPTGTVSKKILLATMYMTATAGHYENGQYSGTIQLKSTLCRFTEDKLHKPYTITKGTTAKGLWDAIHKTYGGWPYWNGAYSFKFGNKVIDFGQTIMSVLQECCGSSKNQIAVDEYGRTVIQKYVAPSKRSASYTIPTGASSVTLPGVDIESTAYGTPNRVALEYSYMSGSGKKQQKKFIRSVGVVADSKTFSKKQTGRWRTETYQVNELSKNTQAALDKQLKSYFANATGTETSYTFECFYLPIKRGQIVNFEYGPIKSKCLVTNIDYSSKASDPALKMVVTVRRV